MQTHPPRDRQAGATLSKKTLTNLRGDTHNSKFDAIAYLFARLKRNWGTAFTSAWEKLGDDRQRERAYRLLQAEYSEVIASATQDDIDAALRLGRAEYPEFPPRPPQMERLLQSLKTGLHLGLPSESDAYRESVRASMPRMGKPHQWSHPAVQRAALDVGMWELTQWPETRSRPLFCRAYAVMVRRVMDGDDLSVPVPKALPAQPTFTDEQQALLDRGRVVGIAWSGDPWDTYRLLVEGAERLIRHG